MSIIHLASTPDVAESNNFSARDSCCSPREFVAFSLLDYPAAALVALLASPRAPLIDLSYVEDASGSGLLHEVARRRDLRLLELSR
ncbi:hypothetical protein DFH07DRAFT_969264 [Mycena maculata]|uniref:Uncharacterized protein n=1 Tax=Mycena maculata TaxID=230809 RepID=A0AAD7MSP0_9AGAR|nr:hypothetical protein DFH07DRAFT_969264 [Mycena maculata]